jgi:hypothetical protein
MNGKSNAATELRDQASELAVAAALELLDLGWSKVTISVALSRPEDWIDLAIDKALAAQAAGTSKH